MNVLVRYSQIMGIKYSQRMRKIGQKTQRDKTGEVERDLHINIKF